MWSLYALEGGIYIIPLVIDLDGSCDFKLRELIYDCACNLYPETVNSFSYRPLRAQFFDKYMQEIQSAVMRESAAIVREAGDLIRATGVQCCLDSEPHLQKFAVTRRDDIVDIDIVGA